MYQQAIRERLASSGYVGQYDPRHVEAWMRIEHGTLDHLSLSAFNSEITLCRSLIDEAGFDDSESLALSYGL